MAEALTVVGGRAGNELRLNSEAKRRGEMPKERYYDYIIIGGGLAGASAVQGIRELDTTGSILLIGDEKHLPYNRPPLTKKLWSGQKKVEEIFVHDRTFYESETVQLELGTSVVELQPQAKTITTSDKKGYRYKKLLLSTGGTPNRLKIPGGDLEGICYYRYLDDFLRIRPEAVGGKSAAVIGGGFIGSEIAAALTLNKVAVTMVFPDGYLCGRVFPEPLGRAIQQGFAQRGVTILAGDKPVSIGKEGDTFITSTHQGSTLQSDMLIVGIGVSPSIDLAATAGLRVSNGIEVNENLQTSDDSIYAAGDNAMFPYPALGERMRVEHWDNALNQGKSAGRNMAGAAEPYRYLPYFFSDLFEFGYEAVGEVRAELETFADWQNENDTGVVYYLKDGTVRGALMCNVWERVDAARNLIIQRRSVSPEQLRGAIR
jgi:3-phenylpropionate/trans-cinnamate dioxygenase ferredoxin reductase component